MTESTIIRPQISSRERVKMELFEAITKGDIRRDMAISERALSEMLGVSRTPVREALQELAREGLVEIHPSRGAFIKNITAKELQDLYEMRLNLECVAAYRAARLGDHRIIQELAPLFEMPENFEDKEVLNQELKNSEAFHLAIFRAADNDLLLMMYEKMLLKVRLSREMSKQHFSERIRQARREHKAIFDAILRRDADEARNLMNRHLRNGFDLRMQVFLTIPEQPVVVLLAGDSPQTGDRPGSEALS
jgi:DNA-binding GntR family transcriptional regulator